MPADASNDIMAMDHISGQQHTATPRLVVMLPAWIFAGSLACLRKLRIKFTLANCGDQGVNHGR
jgi:hypothetical protein